MTRTQWLICIIASIGFAFDIYELLMLPLIVGPALQELIGAAPGSEAFQTWVGRLFYIPAVMGGVFGLLGGYLTDLLGRRRVLTWSILLYALAAFGAGFSTSVEMLLFFRCLVFVGVCVEFVAAVAWLAELFPDPKQREKVLGYTQAFSSIGGLMVAVAYSLCVKYSVHWPAVHIPEFLQGFTGQIKDQHAAWRWTLMSGLIPAIPLIIIRPFLPESPAWAKKRAAGTLRRPSIKQLFSPELRRATIVTTFMFAAAYGAAFGAIQHIPRIVPGLPEVKADAKAASEAARQANADKPAEAQNKAAIAAGKRAEQSAAAKTTKIQEIGGLYGRLLLAVLAVHFLASGHSRLKPLVLTGAVAGLAVLEVVEEFSGGFLAHLQRIALGAAGGALAGALAFYLAHGLSAVVKHTAGNLARVFIIPGLIVMPVVFGWAAVTSLSWLKIGIFVAGVLTVAQFSFWGNYLPRVYPLHLRGTGESFAANIGGRLIGTSFAWVTATLAQTDNPAEAPAKLAWTAAGVGFAVYLAGLILSFYLPEPLPEEPEEA